MGQFLPNKAYVGGINLDPGSYAVAVQFASGTRYEYDVEVSEGSLNLIDAFCLKTGVGPPTTVARTAASQSDGQSTTVAITQFSQDSRYIVLSDARWEPNIDAETSTVKNNSTAKFSINRERIDGQEREVLTMEVKLASGYGWALGRFALVNSTMIQQLQRGSGIRFKVLGDGKIWNLTIPTREPIDYSWYEATIATRKGRVVEIDIPYSKLKQPAWGKKVPFVKSNIMDINFRKYNDSGIGPSTIKVFDFEIY
jgi:hypothetical protein